MECLRRLTSYHILSHLVVCTCADDIPDAAENMPSLLSPELRAQFASGTEEGSRLSYRQRRRNAVRNESSRPRRRIRTLDANWPNWNMARGKRRYGPDCTRSWTVLPRPTTNADHTNSNSLAKEPAAIQGLFIKSSELGKKFTKKQHLKHLRKKEQFGMQLTNEDSEGTIVVNHHTSRRRRRRRRCFRFQRRRRQQQQRIITLRILVLPL